MNNNSGTLPAAANGDAGHKPSPKLAKLTRPQASNAVLRHRLFKRLDDAQERPVVWIHGPPGAGKTTLLASYLTAKKCSGIWYQVDSDDGDPASFFYYLGLAAAAKAPRKRRPMPLLTPEYLLDIEGFTRRFFRELCSRLGDPAVLVFDNYQDVAAPSVFHKVIACALSEVPPGTRAIVLSRTEPPPECARHLANSLITQIGWEDLRLTLDETSLIATARQPVHAELLQTLHEHRRLGGGASPDAGTAQANRRGEPRCDAGDARDRVQLFCRRDIRTTEREHA